jgi:methionyl-tRNA formyltransferase
MRIVFMGTPDFAASSLGALIESPHRLIAVVTQPDRPRGRGHKLKPSPVKALAQKAGLPVLQPQRVREESFLQELTRLKPDLIVVVAFGQKIPRAILDLPPLGCINVHASLLPRWRGASPIQYAILSGDQKTGVSTMYLDEGWDTGDLILQETLELSGQETGGSLHDRLAKVGAKCLLETIELIARGEAPRTPQPQEGAIYAPKLDQALTIINWHSRAVEIERLIRALNPFPGARTYYQGEQLRLWKSSVSSGSDKEPGTILSLSKEGILVQTKDQALLIQQLQRPGGKAMEAAAFLCGYPLEPGVVLEQNGKE